MSTGNQGQSAFFPPKATKILEKSLILKEGLVQLTEPVLTYY